MEKYELIVQEHIVRDWDDLLDHAVVEACEDGTTKISGYIADRSRLYGIFTRMRDLGLKIIKVEKME